MSLSKVQSLEEIALKSCYKEIVSSLRLVNLKSWMSQSCLYSFFPQFSAKQIVDITRERLAQELTATTLNDQVRQKLVQHLTKHISSTDKDTTCGSCQLPDLFLFLDAVLDESFIDLELKVPEKVAVKDEELDLIQLVVKHSPFLSSLNFNFGKPIAAEMGRSFAQSFLELKHLTRLTITDLTDDEYCIPFLESLGTCCPQLRRLCIKSKFLFESKDHILALVLGGKAKLLPKVATLMSRGLKTEKFMKRAHFHPDLLAPFCITLKEVLLQCVECKDDNHGRLRCEYAYFSRIEEENACQHDHYDDDDEELGNKTGRFRCNCGSHHMSRSFLAFLLRHMPNLEKVAENCLDKNFETSRAVEILNTVPSRFYQLNRSEFEDWSTDDDDDSSRMNSESEASAETIIQVCEKRNQLFKGSLALVDLGSVNITSQNVMTAIASLCTRPKAVSLFKTDCYNEFPIDDELDCSCEECHYNFSNVPTSDDEEPPRPHPYLDVTISQEKLQSTLKFNWPKVQDVSLNKLDRLHWQTVYSSIGHQLTRLSLLNVAAKHISIGDFKFCIRLEELEIPGIAPLSDGQLSHGPAKTKLMLMKEFKSFLPNLKKFKSTGCLGIQSFLFEEKNTLTHLDLACSHISTTASNSTWIQVSFLWQNVQELSIASTVNLSPNSLFVLVPRLRKLKSLTLTNRVLKEGDRSIEDLVTKLKEQSPAVNIISIIPFKPNSNTLCPYHK